MLTLLTSNVRISSRGTAAWTPLRAAHAAPYSTLSREGPFARAARAAKARAVGRSTGAPLVIKGLMTPPCASIAETTASRAGEEEVTPRPVAADSAESNRRARRVGLDEEAIGEAEGEGGLASSSSLASSASLALSLASAAAAAATGE